MTPPLPGPDQGLNHAVAAELRAEQGRRKMSVADLAEKADVPYGSLRRYLNAERHIDVSVLAALADALGVSPADLVARAAAAVPDELAARRALPTDLSGGEVNIEDLIDAPSAAHPEPRNDVEGDLDPDLQ